MNFSTPVVAYIIFLTNFCLDMQEYWSNIDSDKIQQAQQQVDQVKTKMISNLSFHFLLLLFCLFY